MYIKLSRERVLKHWGSSAEYSVCTRLFQGCCILPKDGECWLVKIMQPVQWSEIQWSSYDVKRRLAFIGMQSVGWEGISWDPCMWMSAQIWRFGRNFWSNASLFKGVKWYDLRGSSLWDQQTSSHSAIPNLSGSGNCHLVPHRSEIVWELDRVQCS